MALAFQTLAAEAGGDFRAAALTVRRPVHVFIPSCPAQSVGRAARIICI